jgi:adenosylhomocysteinase
MFKGLGANTFVYDKNPLYQLKARSEGHIAKSLEEMLPDMDVVITVTGSFNVLTKKEFNLMKDNVIIGNSGHFGKEINVDDLKSISNEIVEVNDNIKSYILEDKEIHLLSNAAPVNLAAGDGNPIEIMDLGLGLQSLSAVALLERKLENEMHNIPSDITEEVALLSLQ